MATCVLHIGTEKTGTTAFQDWLYSNKRRLSRQGVALTHSGHAPNNRKLVTYFAGTVDDFLVQRGVARADERERFFQGFEDEMAREIQRKLRRHHTFLFTSEHFHSRLRSVAQIAALKRFLDQFFSAYRIVCYFREQSRLRASQYSTAMKGSVAKSLDDFRPNKILANHYFNYRDFFSKWETVFGRDSLYPRLFGTAYFVGDQLCSDLFATVLPEVRINRLKPQMKTLNTSLSAPLATLYGTINSYRRKILGRTPDPTPGLFKQAVGSLDRLTEAPGPVDPNGEAVYQLFEPSNLDFFERYFGVRKNLFPQPVLTSRDGCVPPDLIQDIDTLLRRLLSNPNLIAVTTGEVEMLIKLATALHDQGAIDQTEAITLLRIAHRACPTDKALAHKLERLHLA